MSTSGLSKGAVVLIATAVLSVSASSVAAEPLDQTYTSWHPSDQGWARADGASGLFEASAASGVGVVTVLPDGVFTLAEAGGYKRFLHLDRPAGTIVARISVPEVGSGAPRTAAWPGSSSQVEVTLTVTAWVTENMGYGYVARMILACTPAVGLPCARPHGSLILQIDVAPSVRLENVSLSLKAWARSDRTVGTRATARGSMRVESLDFIPRSS